MKTYFFEATVFVYCISAFVFSEKECSPESFCTGNGYACPKCRLESKNSTGDFEERYYNESRWLSTAIVGESPMAVLNAYTKLKDCIADTRPVVINMSLIDEEKKYYLSFYVPPGAIVCDISHKSITEEVMPGGTMFVRVFEGTTSLPQLRRETKLLQDALLKAKKQCSSIRIVAAYKHPFITYNRHDEVWIPAA